jgi:hypothetical protein
LGVVRIVVFGVCFEKTQPFGVNALYQVLVERVVLQDTKAGLVQAFAELLRGARAGEVDNG